jgi:hypothetical protein
LVRIRCALYPWKLMYVKRLYVGTLKSELSVAWDVCILLYYVYFV